MVDIFVFLAWLDGLREGSLAALQSSSDTGIVPHNTGQLVEKEKEIWDRGANSTSFLGYDLFISSWSLLEEFPSTV